MEINVYNFLGVEKHGVRLTRTVYASIFILIPREFELIDRVHQSEFRQQLRSESRDREFAGVRPGQERAAFKRAKRKVSKKKSRPVAKCLSDAADASFELRKKGIGRVARESIESSTLLSNSKRASEYRVP
jgi:hypothetical protein